MIGRKVNLFIVGQPKTGTTALYYYLKGHSQIFLPDQKQLYYFALDHNNHRRNFDKYTKKYYKKYYNYSFTDYINRYDFKTNQEIYGDITPDYIYSEDAHKAIHDYNPDASIIIILREPLSFLKSFHLQLINSGEEFQKDFLEAINLKDKRKLNSVLNKPSCPPVFFQYDQLIDYKKMVEKYYVLFGSRVKVIIYEDYKNDNHAYLNMIYDFLSIKSNISYKPLNKNLSKEKSSYIRRLREMYMIRLLSASLPIIAKQYLKKAIGLIENKNHIESHFKDEIEQIIMSQLDIKEKIYETTEYLNNNNLLLDGKKVDLKSKWGYD